MTFGELIHATRWAEVEAALLWLFPEQRSQIGEYRRVFRTLGAMAPESNPMRIAIEVRPLPGSNDKQVPEVVGRNGTLNLELDDCPTAEADAENGLSETVYSLSLNPWSKWLGMLIEPATLGAYSPGQIIAYAMVDMTFHGFTESENQEILAELQRRVAELDAMTDEERERDLIPAEEVFARLKSKYGGGDPDAGV